MWHASVGEFTTVPLTGSERIYTQTGINWCQTSPVAFIGRGGKGDPELRYRPYERFCTIISIATADRMDSATRIRHRCIALPEQFHSLRVGGGWTAKRAFPWMGTPGCRTSLFWARGIVFRNRFIQGYPDVPCGDQGICRIYRTRGIAGSWCVHRPVCTGPSVPRSGWQMEPCHASVLR